MNQNNTTQPHELTTFLSSLITMNDDQQTALEEMIRRFYLRVQKESADATDQAIEQAIEDADLDGKVESAVEDKVESAIENVDLDDLATTAVEEAIDNSDLEYLATEAIKTALKDSDMGPMAEDAIDQLLADMLPGKVDDEVERALADSDTERLELLASFAANEFLASLTLTQRLRWLFTGKTMATIKTT